MSVTCDGFEVETLINVRIAKAGLAVAEVPSVEHERIFGESKLHPIRDGLRVLRTIMVERLTSTGRRTAAAPPSFSELERAPQAAGSRLAGLLNRPADSGRSASRLSF